jgi:hypothetical protein
MMVGGEAECGTIFKGIAMKSKQTPSKRKHGLSRLERLLESSIRQELAIKGLRDSLMTLSLRVALLERGSEPVIDRCQTISTLNGSRCINPLGHDKCHFFRDYS